MALFILSFFLFLFFKNTNDITCPSLYRPDTYTYPQFLGFDCKHKTNGHCCVLCHHRSSFALFLTLIIGISDGFFWQFSHCSILYSVCLLRFLHFTSSINIDRFFLSLSLFLFSSHFLLRYMFFSLYLRITFINNAPFRLKFNWGVWRTRQCTPRGTWRDIIHRAPFEKRVSVENTKRAHSEREKYSRMEKDRTSKY